MKQHFRLVHQQARDNARLAVESAPDGYVVEVREPKRSLDQNAKFHAICEDLARSGLLWAGKERTAEEWKVLLVSGHGVATKEGADVVMGLEDELVNLRESTAKMSVARGSSLIEYTLAFCATYDVEIRESD